jgi:hypothetical protein
VNFLERRYGEVPRIVLTASGDGLPARLAVNSAPQLRPSSPPAHTDSSGFHHPPYTVGNATTPLKEADSMDPLVDVQGTTPGATSEDSDRLRLRYGFVAFTTKESS